MKTKNKIAQISHKISQVAYAMLGFNIVLFLILSQDTIATYQLTNLFAINAVALGVYYLMTGFQKQTKKPQWEKVFPILETSKRKKILTKRKYALIMATLVDLGLITTGLFLCNDWGIDWRVTLIFALTLYILNLFLRYRLPIEKDHNWELVYPELALGHEDEDEK